MHLKSFLVALLLAFLIFPFLALAQDQDESGFISIDCGISGVSKYTDAATGINYVSDTGFIETGENHEISPQYKRDGDARQLSNLRSFPDGTRNCYTLNPTQGKGSKYLIRARFMYGNYDDKLKAPTFDLYLGVNFWGTVSTWNSWTQKHFEIIHVSSSDYINVCLVNTGKGIPFISALELRHIGSEIYLTEAGKSLDLDGRFDLSWAKDQVMRYKDDIYDRLWAPVIVGLSLNSSTSDESLLNKGDFEVPFTVMSTACAGSRNSDYYSIQFTGRNITSTYVFYMHFAEVEILQKNQTRQFNIRVNNNWWYGPVTPKYLSTNTIRGGSIGNKPTSEGKLIVWFNNTENANLPPLINAIEVYELKEFPLQQTNQTDVEAISNIKSVYGLKRINWQGDPCSPEAYRWDSINCSYNANDPPRVVFLNLASSGLKGEITPSIANLTMLEYLDLSNNKLEGTNLKGNNFTEVPDSLFSKKDLQLSLDAYLIKPTSCPSGKCGKKHTKLAVPLGAGLGGAFLVALMAVAWSLFKRKRQWNVRDETTKTESGVAVHPGEEGEAYGSTKQQQFTYSGIVNITSNFQRVLGEGGFGKVYHGFLSGKEVAVKMLSSPSIQGHQQFHAELKLLMRVHHKNLTTLVGYCNEGTNIGLIYEYMAKGNLRSHISGSTRRNILTWEERLRIAIDTAQGLEYLHNGCKPPIIYRDVKSTNILLSENLQAKLGDFGLSKIFPMEGGNHVTTAGTLGITTSIAGTPGYLDPEYYITNWLNEKSDVYSFGVVLLEIITARPVLAKTRENSHIIQLVSSMLAMGDITNILDPRLEGVCDINTVWKAVEIAMACVSRTSTNRPIMSRVTNDLKECLTLELARKNSRDVADHSKDSSVEMISRIMVTEFGPIAR